MSKTITGHALYVPGQTSNVRLPMLLTIVPILLVFALGCKEAVGNGDTWFHLGTGRWICEHLSVPRVDPFSFTAADHVYIAHEWLWEVLTYGVWHLCGPTGVILCRALMLILIYLALHAASRTRCRNQAIAIGMVFLGMLSFTDWWSERPQLITYLLATLFAMELHSYRERPSRRIWWLPAAMPVWVNMHGGYFFGLALVGYYAAVMAIERKPGSRTLFYVTGASTVAAILNPYGVQALAYPFWYLGKHRAIDVVIEWASPNFHEISTIPFQILVLLSVAALALSPRRPRIPEVVLFLLLLRTSLYSSRNIPLFALVCVPMVAEALEPIVSHWSHRRAERPSPVMQIAILVSSAAFLLTCLPLGQRPRVQEGNYGKAVGFLESHQLGQRLYIAQEAGGLAIWRLWPCYRVMIDGRLDVYGDRILRDSDTMDRGGEAADGLLAHYDVETVACAQDSPLAHMLDMEPGAWRLAYRDKHACVFARR